MTTAPSDHGAHWRAVTSRHMFGDVVHQARINPLSHFPVTVVELRGTGARSRIRSDLCPGPEATWIVCRHRVSRRDERGFRTVTSGK